MSPLSGLPFLLFSIPYPVLFIDILSNYWFIFSIPTEGRDFMFFVYSYIPVPGRMPRKIVDSNKYFLTG